MSEKHPDFEIEPVNTIQPPEIEYTQTPQALVPGCPTLCPKSWVGLHTNQERVWIVPHLWLLLTTPWDQAGHGAPDINFVAMHKVSLLPTASD